MLVTSGLTAMTPAVVSAFALTRGGCRTVDRPPHGLHAISMQAHDAPSSSSKSAPTLTLPSRRTALLSALVATAALLSGADTSGAVDTSDALVFAVKQTSDPARPYGLLATPEKLLLDKLALNNVVFLGEHHNKADDHTLQAKIIGGLAERRSNSIAVGLEMVQEQFQWALDAYIKGDIKDDAAAEKALYDGVEWAERWQWSYENYLPVFRLARARKIPLIALNVDSAAMEKVRFGGFENLPQKDRDLYVDDKKGFIAFAKTPGFVDYVEKVVMPSYDFHANMGLLGTNPNRANFYSSRILWDEGMSNVARRFLQKDDDQKLMVILEGADHVKFGMGSVGRMKRMAPSFQVASVLLNPTSVDSLTEKDEAPLTLQMPYGGQVMSGAVQGAAQTRPKGVLGLADYLWFSSPPTTSLVPVSMRSVA